MRRIEQCNNSALAPKIALRRKYLKMVDNPKVLDCFCGTGEMFRGAYEGVEYLGLDKNKTHNSGKCMKIDNMIFAQRYDVSTYNVLDLDDWGCPWKLLFVLLSRTIQEKIVVIMTDELISYLLRNQNMPKIVQAVEKIPKNLKIPSPSRWYFEMFQTMLKTIEKKYKYKILKAEYFQNKGKKVCYWGLVLGKK